MGNPVPGLILFGTSTAEWTTDRLLVVSQNSGMQHYCNSKPKHNDLVTSISINLYLFSIPVNHNKVSNIPETRTMLCNPNFDCCLLFRDIDTRR